MSAQAANVVAFPSAKRAPQAQPVAKLRVLEHVCTLIGDGELQHVDMTVAAYIAKITDKATGWACVEYATIGERIGRHRTTAIRSIKRLMEAGVIERQARRAGKRCFASLYRLVDPVGETTPEKRDTPRCTDAPTPVHGCTTSRGFTNNLPPNGPAPERGRDDKKWSCTFWVEQAEWLATHGKYARWGPGPGEAYMLAKDDLDRWRERCGDRAVVRAIERAKGGNGGQGWFGEFLIERLDAMLGDG